MFREVKFIINKNTWKFFRDTNLDCKIIIFKIGKDIWCSKSHKITFIRIQY